MDNWLAARNQDGVLSHREWTVCSPCEIALSRKALAAVLLLTAFHPRRTSYVGLTILYCIRGGQPMDNWLAAQNQDGVLSYRE